MILTRTPFRVSLAGGGSDLSDYYEDEEFGAVTNLTIQRYMYIAIHPYFHSQIRLKYSKVEDVSNVSEVEHPILREVLRKLNVEPGIEIASFADIPAGTGMGSSSAFAVGLLNALHVHRQMAASKEQLAREACEIEIDVLKEPIGRQDQYAVSYGGINYIRFYKGGRVEVTRVGLGPGVRDELHRKLRLYYVGGEHRAGEILQRQAAEMATATKRRVVQQMVALAAEVRKAVEAGAVRDLGALLHEGWEMKKGLVQGITNSSIESAYDRAMRNGALGGKLLGAGGAGFLLLVADDHHRLQRELGCRTIPVLVDEDGASVLFKELDTPQGQRP